MERRYMKENFGFVYELSNNESSIELERAAHSWRCFSRLNDHVWETTYCFMCWGKDEAAVLQEETGKKQPLQLEQQLIQTEQHLENLMAQLDPLFECVTTLAGAQ
ncbi:hypothetical protein H8959_016761 [Pygathrix nigripes]